MCSHESIHSLGPICLDGSPGVDLRVPFDDFMRPWQMTTICELQGLLQFTFKALQWAWRNETPISTSQKGSFFRRVTTYEPLQTLNHHSGLSAASGNDTTCGPLHGLPAQAERSHPRIVRCPWENRFLGCIPHVPHSSWSKKSAPICRVHAPNSPNVQKSHSCENQKESGHVRACCLLPRAKIFSKTNGTQRKHKDQEVQQTNSSYVWKSRPNMAQQTRSTETASRNWELGNSKRKF